MPAVLIKNTGYKSHRGGKAAKGMAAIKAHMKYIEQRPDEHGQKAKREMFTRDQDGANRKDFHEKLENQPEKGVIAHKLVISMERKDFDNRNINMKELTRDIMTAFEAKTDRRYEWIAVEHYKSSNPHAHIVIAGRDSNNKEVTIMPHQLKQLKRIAQNECNRLTERNQTRNRNWDLEEQLERERQLEIPLDLTKAKELHLERIIERMLPSRGRGLEL